MKSLTSAERDALLHVRIASATGDRSAELRIAAVRQLAPLITPPERRTAALLASRMPTEIQAVVARLDGKPTTRPLAEALWADRAAALALLAARSRAYATLAERGRVFALCPHCRQAETELSVFALVAGLDDGPWPVTDSDGCLAVPSLATLRPDGDRPAGARRAARIRVTLPSAECGIDAPLRSCVIGDLTADADAAAWRTWAPEGVEQPEERFYWRYQHPGFRAVLRLAVIVGDPDGGAAVTPQTIEAMPAIDFFFLDNAYYLTHNIPVRAGRLDLHCDACGGTFLPVR